MLSIENPSDLSCSSKISRSKKNHERVSEKLALEEADLASSHLDDKTQLPKFSIRDYVVSARSKEIGNNWPFQQKFLQSCLKHGLKDVLPPFEAPDSIRARCYAKKVESDQLVSSVNAEKAVTATDYIERICISDKEANNIRDELRPQTDGSALDEVQLQESVLCDKEFDKKAEKHRSSLESSDSVENKLVQQAENASPLTSDDRIDGKTSDELNLSSTQVELNGFSEASTERLEEESDFTGGLGLILETGRNEENLSNSSSLSEPMASKVCPVCKAFMSPSNTTLNAHIDECLKVESTSNSAATNQIKHKIKPKKKRSMVDIYATAPRCTLEELDRRNGTNWAENSSCFPSSGDLETKRQRISPPSFMGEDDDSAVYVDSNGTKLRILSKLGDDLKDSNNGASTSGYNRRQLSPNNSKDLKIKPYSKKLSSLKPQKNEILEALKEASCVDDEGRKEKSLSQLQKARAGTLSQWACSKRSILPKQPVNNGVKDMALLKQHTGLKFKSNRLKEGNSSREENHTPKFSRSLGNSDPFPSFRKLDNQLNPEQKTGNGRKVSLAPSKKTNDGCIIRFKRSSGNYVASPRSKRVEIYFGTDQNADNVPKTSPKPSENYCYCLPPDEANSLRKASLLGESDLPRTKKKCDNFKERLIFRKPQNKVPGTKTREWVGEMPPEKAGAHDCVCDSSDFFGSKSVKLNKINRTNKFSLPKNVAMFETAEFVDGGTVGGSNLLKTRRKPEMRGISQRKEKPILKAMKRGDKELTRNTNMVLASSNENIGGLVVKSNRSLRVSPRIDQIDIQDRTLVESEMPSICSNQETFSEEITDGFTGMKDQREAAINARLEKSLSGIGNSGAKSAPNQGLETSFPKQGDTGFEAPQNESLIGNATSSPQSTALHQVLCARDEHNHFDKEISRSPWVSSSEPSVISSDANSSRGENTRYVSDCELSSGMIVTNGGRMRGAPEKEPVEISDNRIRHSQKEYVCQEKVPDSEQSTVAKTIEEYIVWQDSRSDDTGVLDPEPHMGHVSANENSGSVMKFPVSGSQDFATGLAQSQAPSPSNPILRLMGKNLLVASKDEVESNQLSGFSSGTPNNHPNTNYLSLLEFSPHNDYNKDKFSLYDDGSFIFGQESCKLAQNFVGISNKFGNHSNPQTHQPPTDAGNRCEMPMGGFSGSGSCFNGVSAARTQQNKPNKRPNSGFAFNPHRRHQIPVSDAQADRSVHEVIVIDDSPEVEANPSTVYKGFGGVNQSSQVGTSSTISSSVSKPVGAFSYFPSQSAFAYTDPPAGLGSNFLVPCPGVVNTSLGKRGSGSEGPGVLLPNPYILPSVSIGRVNPTLYYSQRLW